MKKKYISVKDFIEKIEEIAEELTDEEMEKTLINVDLLTNKGDLASGRIIDMSGVWNVGIDEEKLVISLSGELEDLDLETVITMGNFG